MDDCPTDDPEKIRQVDSLTRKTVTEWKSSIRTAVALEAAGAVATATAAKVGLEQLVVRAQVALLNNPVKAWAAGYALGVGKAHLSGTGGLPTPRLATKAMQDGYVMGQFVGTFLKQYGF